MGEPTRLEERHRCEPPNIGGSVTISRMFPWECGICGRVWTRSNWTWEETRGPLSDPEVK